uniref:LITAF domain-containing protein n=1 Tax=Parastrongyloides trichosuri TaxID=131310 RepID=A0A0N4ZNA4_PARTI
MRVELASVTSNTSITSSLTSCREMKDDSNFLRKNKSNKKVCCSTCKETMIYREKMYFNILLYILKFGYIFVTFLGLSLIFRKPLCHILHGLLQYYSIE